MTRWQRFPIIAHACKAFPHRTQTPQLPNPWFPTTWNRRVLAMRSETCKQPQPPDPNHSPNPTHPSATSHNHSLFAPPGRQRAQIIPYGTYSTRRPTLVIAEGCPPISTRDTKLANLIVFACLLRAPCEVHPKIPPNNAKMHKIGDQSIGMRVPALTLDAKSRTEGLDSITYVACST